jgi:hypothetical protein
MIGSEGIEIQGGTAFSAVPAGINNDDGFSS